MDSRQFECPKCRRKNRIPISCEPGTEAGVICCCQVVVPKEFKCVNAQCGTHFKIIEKQGGFCVEEIKGLRVDPWDEVEVIKAFGVMGESD